MILTHKRVDERLIYADLGFICSNLTRASILHLLINSKKTGYSLPVKEISHRLGKHHKIVIHHLEILEDYGIVHVVKRSRNGKRRIIWGLSLGKPELIKEIYSHIVRYFFSLPELERATRINKKIR